MIPPPPSDSSDPWTHPAPLWAGRLLVGAVVAWIVHRVWAGLFIPWWFNTDELVFFNEVVRQLRLDPGQTFFDIPGTPYMTLTSLLTATWWAIERALGLSQSASASDFAFDHIQGVFMLMRSITLGCYAVAIGLAYAVFRYAAGVLTGVFAAILAATLPIHVHYSHFVRTESLGLVLCLVAILSLLHPRSARRWKTYLFAGILAGFAMGARFHFALVGLPVLLALYFLHDRPHLDLADEKLPHPQLLRIGATLAGLFIIGGIIAGLFRSGVIGASGLTHTLLLSTAGGETQFPGAKQAVVKLWMLLGAGSLGLTLLYRVKFLRPRVVPFVNPFTLALLIGFAGGFLFSHPSFLWRGAHQLHSIQFYSDWVDPDLASLGLVGSWWKVTRYYFTTALPETWLQIAFFAGIGTILWSRNRIAISFLIGALVCFVAHPVTMKLWAHHIIPWLPLLCFVAAHPFGRLLQLLTRRLRRPLVPVILLAACTALLVAALPARLARADEYLRLSRARTSQIEEMNRWLTLHVPFDSYLAVSYYALNGDGFVKWIESMGVTVPSRMMLYPDTHIWMLQRDALDGRAGYVCITRADIVFFRDDAERKAPGSTYNPFEDRRFEEVAVFGAGVYELKVFKFDLRSEPLPPATNPTAQSGNTNFLGGNPIDAPQPDGPASATSPDQPEDRAERNTRINRLLAEQAELQKTIATLNAQVEKLTHSTQRQEIYAVALKKESDRLDGERTEFKRQVETLTATAKQQVAFIAGLEKERERLTQEAAVAATEAKRATTDAQKQIDALLAQITQFTTASKQQADFIAVLKQENDRLAALAAAHDKDIAHYVKVINEQTAYIKQLEAQRAAAAAP